MSKQERRGAWFLSSWYNFPVKYNPWRTTQSYSFYIASVLYTASMIVIFLLNLLSSTPILWGYVVIATLGELYFLIVFFADCLPVILVAAIEFAIFINMGIPYYTGTTLPFIASIVIGTIQLGSTVDYAILMTTRYRTERESGKDRKESIYIAHSTSIASILVSAFSFFAATFGVGLYSEIDMISSLCTLMARGALISMVTVIFILPALLYAFDRVILYTSLGFRPKKQTDISGTAVHSRNVVHQGGNL